MKHSALLVLACAAALTLGCNGKRTDNTIATSDTVGTAGSNSVSNSDKSFVSEQLADGAAEVELAKLAKERAASPEVKQFAQMMIDDHTSAGKLLKQIAATYAIPEPSQPDKEDKELMDKLSKLRGSEFDREYMEAMVEEHEEAVKALRSRVDENRSLSDRLQGKNPEDRAAVKPELSDDKAKMSVNEWAANVLPTVEHHLNRAREIKERLDHPNATARTNSSTPAKKGY
jgi:predicted outer membrane protein